MVSEAATSTSQNRPSAEHQARQRSDAATDAPQQLEVPDPPSLLPNAALKGQMTESAFRDPPWLIDRGGVYIVVPKLLYEVAAAIDGRRDHEQIAESVTAATERGVTAEHVRVLLAKLMLMGVVADQDRRPAVPPEALDQPGSVVGLNFKLKMLSPRLIEPIANALRFLYWPPVLLVALIAASAVEVWLYAVHGIGESFRQAVYTAGLMLVVVGIVVVATLFHEFGHAAALRYAGGRVRAMGVGLYLVYPAFYTDVTDNYRLGRRDRLRTDLGGFYFNLLFVIALMGLYVLTGLEFLLVIIVILNIEILHQMLPFIRFDGYWALADLTGIPDFYAHMGPFLRSVLPDWVPLPKGSTLPPLKTWGKLFYAAYILITVPLLLFMLYLMLRTLPRFVATVADASSQLLRQLGEAVTTAQIVLGGAIVVQLIFLLLPLLGLALLFTRLARRGVGLAWTWGTRSPAHRLIASSATAATILLLMVLWIPGLLGPGPAPIAAVIRFDPFTEGERFTIGDAVRPWPRDLGGTPDPSGEPGLSSGGSPGSTLAPGAASTITPSTPPGGAAPPPTPTRTPAPTPLPMPTPTRTPSPTPTPTPTSATPIPTPEPTPPPETPIPSSS
jgi:putative peptide zinc metalloprotease protein